MFIAGVNDTGEKLFSGVNETSEKFIAGVNDTGHKLVVVCINSHKKTMNLGSVCVLYVQIIS
jgi:hypothetical protein